MANEELKNLRDLAFGKRPKVDWKELIRRVQCAVADVLKEEGYTVSVKRGSISPEGLSITVPVVVELPGFADFKREELKGDAELTRIRPPDQIIQPYQFGHDVSKATCLWLRGLPLLKPTQFVPPRMVGNKPRWGNQTPSGNDRHGQTPSRAADRSRTYQGIADAMADQWSRFLAGEGRQRGRFLSP